MSRERDELALLAEQIGYHEGAYREGAPELPDAAFDDLVERYEALADQLGVPPEQRVNARPGADHTEGFQTVEHRFPMLSLEKLSPARRDNKGAALPVSEQLRAWYDRRRKDLELGDDTSLALIVEPKIDGISVSLSYPQGQLRRAVTRGDGQRGDDITRQVLESGAVPQRLRGVSGELELRGELYWPQPAFDAYNEKLRAAGERLIVNPRNGCAGLMKRKDPTGLGELGVKAFLYQVAWAPTAALPRRQSQVLAWLADAGAPVYLSEIFTSDSLPAILEYCKHYEGRRDALDFDIDGMVIKVEDLASYDRLGSTGHHPHWGIAYKFPPERKSTTLLGVQVQVGNRASSRRWRSWSRSLSLARWYRVPRCTTSPSSSAKTCASAIVSGWRRPGKSFPRWSASSSSKGRRAPCPWPAPYTARAAAPRCSRRRSSSIVPIRPARRRCASGWSTSPAGAPWTSTAWGRP